jgi:hypothetical protein
MDRKTEYSCAEEKLPKALVVNSPMLNAVYPEVLIHRRSHDGNPTNSWVRP